MVDSDGYEGTLLKTTTNVVDFTLNVDCERIYGQYLTDRCTKGAFLGSATTLEKVTFPDGSQLKEFLKKLSCSNLKIKLALKKMMILRVPYNDNVNITKLTLLELE